MNRLIELNQLNEAERQAVQDTHDMQSEAISVLDELQQLYIDTLSIIGRFSREPNKRLSLMFATAAFHTIRAAYDLTIMAHYISAATFMRLLLFQYLYSLYYWDNREEAKKFSKGPRKTIALQIVRDLRRQLTPAEKKAVRGHLTDLRKEIESEFYQVALVYYWCLKRGLTCRDQQIKNTLRQLEKELKRGYAPTSRQLLDSLERCGVFTNEKRIEVNKTLNTLHRFVHGEMGPTQEVIKWPHPRLWPKYGPAGFRFCARHLLIWGFELIRFLKEKHRRLQKHLEWQAAYERFSNRWLLLFNLWNAMP